MAATKKKQWATRLLKTQNNANFFQDVYYLTGSQCLKLKRKVLSFSIMSGE
tara:strand:+ start:699 stop:851 length:153 start_codon:yes stop_codon:yes gene_type:complete